MNSIGVPNIKRIPPKVLTPTVPELDNPSLRDKNIKAFDIPKQTKLERLIDDGLNERDKMAAGLLDLDDKYNALQNVLDDQLKNMNIPVSNRNLREAVRAFGGDGDFITKAIYDKAKATQKAINAAMGLNPLHIPFAKPTKGGKALTQYTGDVLKNCSEISAGFPNQQVYKADKEKAFIPSKQSALHNDGLGQAGTNPDGSLLTTIENLLNKAALDIIAFLQYKLFWDIIYHKFLKRIILVPFKTALGPLKKFKDKKIIGRFVKPFYCLDVKWIDFFDTIPTRFGIRPPPISGDETILKDSGLV